MKPLWRGVLVGTAAYLLFMVVNAPAAKLLPMLQSRLEGVSLAGVEGRLWSGKAALVDASPVRLQDARWRFRPFALILGDLEFAVEGRLGGESVKARVGSSLFGQYYLSGVEGRISASDLMYWLDLTRVKLDGQLDFDIAEVEWPESGFPAVSGTIVWSPARVAAPIELALGKARLETRIEDAMTRGTLEASGGTLLVQAEVAMEADGAYRLDADIQQKGDVPQAVEKFLSTFADYKNGTYRLEWSDTL